MIAIAVIVAESSRVSPLPSLGTIITYLAGIATVISALFMYFGAKQERRNAQRQRREAAEREREGILRLQQDFYGDQRPGVPTRPGVLEVLGEMTTKVDAILAEVNYNHGGSIKDAVDRIDTRLESVESDVKGIHDRLDNQGGTEVHVHT